MLKTIQLKLSQIKYTGNSIGDDIRAEIEILDKIYRIDKQIKKRSTAKINEEIGNFKTDQKIFNDKVKITIIEKDFLYNDVGSIESNMKINSNSTKPQKFVYKIQIKETRTKSGRPWGKRTATFEVTLEAVVSDVIKYIRDDDDAKGWVWAILDDDKSKKVDLPAFLKVKMERADAKREYFTILEGTYRGKSASIKLEKDGSSWLIAGVKHEPMAKATYSISEKIFTLNNKKYQATDHPDTPWKKGLYDIEIPDSPHSGGARYQKKAPRAKTWFRVGHTGERYLHTGNYSLGCMTITEVSKWMEIYNALIKARKGDSMSVGVLEVAD